AVLSTEPNWQALPPAAARLRPLARCLKKDAKQRLQAIGDARIEIDDLQNLPEADRAEAPVGPRLKARWLFAAALSLVTAIAGVQGVRLSRQPAAAPTAPEIRLEIATPLTRSGAIVGGSQTALAISPDGLKIVYSSPLDGRLVLWLRLLGSVTARPLAGTDT